MNSAVHFLLNMDTALGCSLGLAYPSVLLCRFAYGNLGLGTPLTSPLGAGRSLLTGLEPLSRLLVVADCMVYPRLASLATRSHLAFLYGHPHLSAMPVLNYEPSAGATTPRTNPMVSANIRPAWCSTSLSY